MIKIDIRDCNFDHETCPVLKKIYQEDVYCEQMSDIDPAAADVRKVLGIFADACARNQCPGQHMETTRETLRQIITRRDKDSREQ